MTVSEILSFEPALSRPELLSPSILACLQSWQDRFPVEHMTVAEIKPDFAKGYDLCQHYNLSHDESANCVIIEALRDEKRVLAACVVPMTKRINLNSTARKALNARRVSMAPLEEVLQKTQMEYGSITPVGLPEGWPILMDQILLNQSKIIVGAVLLNQKFLSSQTSSRSFLASSLLKD